MPRPLSRIPVPRPLSEEAMPAFGKEDATWWIFRAMAEFVSGFQFLSKLRREVSVFGSARFTEKNPHYKQARALAHRLAKAGYTMITGGGPGIMEAANRGASEGGGESVGLDIELPSEQRRNKFVKKGIGFNFFFTRKVILSASAQAYIFFPGGFGTLDEMSEILTLIQTRKMERVPVILFGRDFWQPFDAWVRRSMLEAHHSIDQEDIALYAIVDTVDEALAIIKKTKERKFF